MQYLRVPHALVPLAVGLSLAAAPAALAHTKAHATKANSAKANSAKANSAKASSAKASSAKANAAGANATTSGASAIGATSAFLSGSVNPGGHAATYRFDYRPLGTAPVTKTVYASAGSGSTPVTVTVNITGLQAATSYQYRIAAVSSTGTAYGSVSKFTTTGGTATVGTPPAITSSTPILNPQTAWAPVGAMPMSDSAAAALVTPEPEVRPANAAANDYVPTAAQLAAFYHSTPGFLNDPLRQYVTGSPGLTNPSTDDLIQWAAHKWGIPEDVIRAEMVVESDWNMTKVGDRTTVSSSWYGLYPAQAQIPATSDVYQSMGVMQVRWLGDNSGVGAGTEPLRWESTAFNLDFYAATVRWLYDGYTAGFSWVPNIYKGQTWTSIGGWYGGGGNTASQNYVRYVQNTLASRTWAQPGF